jgi:hypothetical protein
MKKRSQNFKEYFIESLTWVLPVGIATFMFIVLFFGLSIEVGNLKAADGVLESQIVYLSNELSKTGTAKTDVPKSTTSKVTYSNESFVSEGNITTGTQTIMLSGGKYWGYSFAPLQEISSMSFSNSGSTYIVNYVTKSTPNEGKTEAFELFQIGDDNAKSIKVNNVKYQNLAVFVDGHLIVFNDFSTNDKSVLKSVLQTISTDKLLSKDLQTAASNELKGLN